MKYLLHIIILPTTAMPMPIVPIQRDPSIVTVCLVTLVMESRVLVMSCRVTRNNFFKHLLPHPKETPEK